MSVERENTSGPTSASASRKSRMDSILRRIAGAIVLSAAALAPGATEAAPVPLTGVGAKFSAETECAPYCGSTDVTANILGIEGAWVDGRFQGGGAAQTSAAVSGGGFFGKAATALAQFSWESFFIADPAHQESDPLNLFLDTNLTLFANHSAFLGVAEGGIQLSIAWVQCFGFFVCNTAFSETLAYQETMFVENLIDLGPFNPKGFGFLEISFVVGSTAGTFPLFGANAFAFDVGTFDFTFFADDGQLPPEPIPAPSSLNLMLVPLAIFGLMHCLRSPRLGAISGWPLATFIWPRGRIKQRP